jgi:hypothetical protein
MKSTPILEELKIMAEAADYFIDAEPDDEHPEPMKEATEILEEDILPAIAEVTKRHKKLCNVLREALAWCKQDATNEDCFPSQDMLDARVDRLKEALKLARQ